MSNKGIRRTIIGLLISTTSLAILCVLLTTIVIMRPTVIEKVDSGPGVVTYDLGNGRKITAPGDGIIEWSGNFTDITTPTSLSRTDEAEAVGVAFKATGANGKFILEMDFELPEANIPDGPTSLAGHANMGVKAIFSNGATSIYIIAALSILVGCVLGFWLKAWKVGLGFIVGGVTMFAVAKFFTTYPWVLLILFFVVIAVVGFILWDYWKKRKTGETMDAIIAAGEGLPTKVKAAFTKLVSAEAQARGVSSTAKKIVSELKTKSAVPLAKIDLSDELKEIYETLKEQPNNLSEDEG